MARLRLEKPLLPAFAVNTIIEITRPIKIVGIIFILLIYSTNTFSQCTEAKDADMAKYKRLTETQDAQGCSQCAMLALYFCSAKHCVEAEDKRKVRSLIEACKTNIKTMGQPYCCPELVNKTPEWGVAVSSGSSSKNTTTSNADNSAIQQQKSFEALASGLESNPDNPLAINNALLNEIAGLIPDENLKNILQGYSQSLSNNEDVSFRQIYSDVLSAFDLNPAIGMMNDYGTKQGALDLMFNQPMVFQDFYRNSGIASSDTEARFFSYTTQAMLTNYQNVNSADVVGALSDFVTMFTEDAERGRALAKRYNEMLEITKKNYLLEKDVRLSGALIDASIGSHELELLTPIFRYDSDSGYSLRVENGVLTYINSKLNKSIPLAKVNKRNNSSYSSASSSSRNFLLINEVEEIFFMRISDELPNNVGLKKGLYLLSTRDGSIIWKTNKALFKGLNIELLDVEDAIVSKEGVKIYSALKQGKSWTRSKRVHSLLDNSSSLAATINKNIFFDFQGKDDNPFFSTIMFDQDNSRKSFTVSENDYDLSLIWRAAKNDYNSITDLSHTTSSAIIVGKNHLENANIDGMTNVLTGIAKSKNGNLFFSDSKGNLGFILKENYSLSDVDFASQINRIAKKKLFPVYNFISMNDKTTARSLTSNFYPGFPRLFLSPDDKWLLYTVKDELFIVDPSDFTKVNTFKLTNEPHRSYFGKENGDWVLYLESINDFQFPITKKYSMKRLTQYSPSPASASLSPTKPIEQRKTNISSQESKDNELQKLIDLFTKGLITEDEFKKAKAKIIQK